MMIAGDDLRELYQEVILDHSRHPRNFGRLESCDHEAHGYNPLCGDSINVYVRLDDHEHIEDISFDGRGCAISTASASIMTEMVKGKDVTEARRLFDGFHKLLTGKSDTILEEDDAAERLQVLAGVKQFPVRIKCATLSWHALQSALDGDTSASTEH
jgi:nitrogen fixation NifU-like protein